MPDITTTPSDRIEADRLALLSALGFKPTAMDVEAGRAIVLNDARLLRPQLVKARHEVRELQSKYADACRHRSEELDAIAKALRIDVSSEAWWELSHDAKHEKILARLAVVAALRGPPVRLP